MTIRPSSRTLASCIATVLLVAGGCADNATTVAADEPAPPQPIEAPPEKVADTGLAWRTIDVVDPTRPTDEVVDGEGAVVLAGSSKRTIPVEVVYEGADGGGEDAIGAAGPARPLVIWMNGLGGRAAAGDPLLLALFEAGYTVAAPNSPEISAPASSPADFPELPADASVVIDALVDPADGVADDLASLVDPDRIGMAGHSIGASAVLGSVFHDCCRDDRVSAAVTFGASTAFRFDDTDYDFGGTPLLLVHGDDDKLFPVSESESILAGADAGSHLLVLPGSDHFTPVHGDDTDAGATTARRTVIAFFDVHLAGTADVASLDDFASTLPDGMWRSAD
jgi:predicted dienelactone hydrolase